MGYRPSRRTHHVEESIHLNITPFIDIMVCLILFLLSAAAFLKLGVVDTNLPRLADSAVIEDKKDDDKLIVSVKIDGSGFRVDRVGADRDATKQRRWEDGGDLRRFFPKDGSGNFNLSGLTEQMKRIKSVYPDAVSVMILPAGNVSYQTIVDVMDATREAPIPGDTQRIRLFPDAIIGHSMEEGGI